MANYQWYKPILGSVDYIWQIPAHIDETENIANEVETARGLQATLIDNLDTKANLSGDTFTGEIIVERPDNGFYLRLKNTGTTNEMHIRSFTNGFFGFRPAPLGTGDFTKDFLYDFTNGYWRFDTTPKVGINNIWHEGNDGSGSGLDADTLDTYEGADYTRKAAVQTITANWQFTQDSSTTGRTLAIFEDSSTENGFRFRATTAGNVGIQPTIAGIADSNKEFYFDTLNGYWRFDPNGAPRVGINKIWHEGNDGSGSGLDADKLDTFEADYFVSKSVDQTITSKKTFSGLNNTNLLVFSNTTTTNQLVLQNYSSDYIGFRPAPGGTEDGTKDFMYNFTNSRWQFDQVPYVVNNPLALLESPVFSGTPSLPTGTTAVTQASTDNDTSIATTAFVKTAVSNLGITNRVYITSSGGNWTIDRQTLTSGKGFVNTLTDLAVGQCRLNFTTATSINNVYFIAIQQNTTGIGSAIINAFTASSVAVRLFGTSSEAQDNNFFVEIFIDE